MTSRSPFRFAEISLLALIAGVSFLAATRPPGGSPPAGYSDLHRRALAEELGRLWTEEPRQLVQIVEQAALSAGTSTPVTFLLAIAHVETHGKILTVSEAGAVGLAQATPIAYLQEGYDGRLFLTDDYLAGARAYFVKKPLGDADKIATLVLESRTPPKREEIARLIAAARELRREGLDDLGLLAGRVPPAFFEGVEAADRRNRAALDELESVLASSDRGEIERYRDGVRAEYRALRKVQTDAWKRYQKDLLAQRDRILEAHYGISASEVNKTRRYEASELLAVTLDERFSATAMATFLARHVLRKEAEARDLAGDGGEIEAMTAALYNGGSTNVRRMRAGLISSLPETDRYARKVPDVRARLDRSLAGLR